MGWTALPNDVETRFISDQDLLFSSLSSTASLITIGGFAAVVKSYFFATALNDRRFDVASFQHKLMFV